jgi:hypothetical protein
MCLENSSLGMKYSKKEGCFTGVGYKQLDVLIPSQIRNKGDAAILRYLTKKYCPSNHLVGGWMEARGGRYSKIFERNSIEFDCQGGKYWPGFHIFTEQEDAENYYQSGLTIMVEYAEVTDFGRNETGSGDGPCVIARYMRFMEIVNDDTYDEDEDEEDTDDEDY